MADDVVLQARLRRQSGKQAAKHLRQQGYLPAVVYGDNEPTVPCLVDRKHLEDILHTQGRNTIISLVLEDGKDAFQTTIIKEIQQHPIGDSILHVDFHRISLTEKIVLDVSVVGVGIPVGVRADGGILEHMLYTVEVECLPTQIPERIELDVSEMRIGDTVHVSDLSVGGDVRIVTEGDRSVFVVVPPTVVKEVEEEEEEGVEVEEEEMQEPEVIERGRRGEEEAEEGRSQ
jgi:large subunit ribosomal protein L25